MPSTETKVTAASVDRDVDRGIKFLRTLSISPAIRRHMVQVGYNEDEHRAGWTMLLGLLGYRNEPTVEPYSSPLTQQRAIAELDAWDGPAFTRARAALERLHPDQAVYIFEGLTAETGAAAIGSVKTFLDRVAMLRQGSDPARAGSRDADLAAVATLEQRNIVGESIEAHLRELLEEAIQLAPVPAAEEHGPVDDEYVSNAHSFHAWLSDWRETARSVITRRDYLIRLGLAKRRTKTQDTPDDEIAG